MKLQSVELRVPNVEETARFFEQVWNLSRTAGMVELREGPPAILSITFSGAETEREVKGPDGDVYRFTRQKHPVPSADRDRPLGLSHVVLNSADVDAAERFAVEKLGFKVSDRTRHMTFLRCDRKHHCIAYARAGFNSLNHIAFDMPDIDGVMRGIGRLREAGYPAVWGPGRHGPGNNVFAYFIGPHGGVVEYTSEVSEVGDDYRVGGPDDWKWPAGRIDHWGASTKDTARISEAEKAFAWAS